MQNRVKICVFIFCVAFVAILFFAASEIRPNSFLLQFYDKNVALLDEDGICLNVPLGQSRHWIKGIENDSDVITFCLPAGCAFSEVRSFQSGKVMNVNDSLDFKKKIQFIADHTLPSAFINTDLERGELVADKNLITPGKMDVFDPNGTLLQSQVIYFKGHGNNSWERNEKKSWLIKTEEDIAILGMKAGCGYVALANAQDGSFLRNHMTFDMARNLGMADTPDDRFVNLYLNGDYQGLYLLTTRIEVSGERLQEVQLETPSSDLRMEAFSIYNLQQEDNGLNKGWVYPDGVIEDPLDTGFLFAQVTIGNEIHYEDMDAGFWTQKNDCLRVLYPDNASIEQVNALRVHYDAFLDAIGKAQDTEQTDCPDGSYLQYIDLDSFVKKHLIEQFSKNHDANAASSYYTIRNLKSDPLIYEGPVWDYDTAYGNYIDNAEWDCPGNYIHFPPGLTRISSFVSLQNMYYIRHLKIYLETRFQDEMVATADAVSDSVKMDITRWPNNMFRKESYEAEVEDFETFVADRKQFFDDTIIHGKTFRRVNFVSGGMIVGCLSVEDGKSLAEVLNASQNNYPDSFLKDADHSVDQFIGWFEEDLETPIDFTESVSSNLACYALWSTSNN